MSPPSQPPNHYEVLELPPGASPGELRQSFRLLSKRYHPDTTDLPAEQAGEAFARLRQAYAVLADPTRRRLYDAELQRRRLAALPPVPPPPGLTPSGLTPRSTPIGVRRSLSGGEWFALVLLAMALGLSLVLGVGLAWARGMALVTEPSWWSEAGGPAAVLPGLPPPLRAGAEATVDPPAATAGPGRADSAPPA